MSVVRLPVQHKNAPHCPRCERNIPPFDGLLVSTIDDMPAGLEVIAITLHTRCACGQLLDLRKTVKP